MIVFKVGIKKLCKKQKKFWNFRIIVLLDKKLFKLCCFVWIYILTSSYSLEGCQETVSLVTRSSSAFPRKRTPQAACRPRPVSCFVQSYLHAPEIVVDNEDNYHFLRTILLTLFTRYIKALSRTTRNWVCCPNLCKYRH